MDTHNIHGTDVNFHSDDHEVRDFFKHGMHSETAQDYFKKAEKEGESHVILPNGDRYKVSHEKGEDGKSTFSVEKSHHHY